jgi:receptor protein-tyrosine kinase
VPHAPDAPRDGKGSNGSNGIHPAWRDDINPIHGEAFKTLRSNLLLRTGSDDRSLLITSARPGEGKSTVLANLALALTAIRKRVAAVDADMRRPRLHELLQAKQAAGLREVLAGTLGAMEACQQTELGPWVMTSGSLTEDPQRLLGTGRFREMIQELKRQFDYVLVDCTPVLAVADPMLVAPHVDGVILVARCGVVTEAEALLAKERFQNVRSKLIGCVLNGIDEERQGTYNPYVTGYADARSQRGDRKDPS